MCVCVCVCVLSLVCVRAEFGVCVCVYLSVCLSSVSVCFTPMRGAAVHVVCVSLM